MLCLRETIVELKALPSLSSSISIICFDFMLCVDFFFRVFINWFFALGLHLDRMAKASTKKPTTTAKTVLVSFIVAEPSRLRWMWKSMQNIETEQHFICRCRHFQTNVFIRVCTQWCIHYGIYIALHCGSFMHIESIVVIDYCMFCFAKLLW